MKIFLGTICGKLINLSKSKNSASNLKYANISRNKHMKNLKLIIAQKLFGIIYIKIKYQITAAFMNISTKNYSFNGLFVVEKIYNSFSTHAYNQ